MIGKYQIGGPMEEAKQVLSVNDVLTEIPDELFVESVQVDGVVETLKKFDITGVPCYFIKPSHLRPQFVAPLQTGAGEAKEDHIPVVDMSSSHEDLVKMIGDACKWGFFQIINHGVSKDLIERVSREAEEFFALPVGDKTRCTTKERVKGPVHFGSGTEGDWRDVLKLQCAPPSAVAMDYWPRKPVGFRETLMLYFARQQELALRLFGIISESLGLEKGYIREVCKSPRALIVMNHYPPCPDPSLTIGIRQHSDPNTITILLQDQVKGLQVNKEGQWVDVLPLENALVVNVGDHLQILSNRIYSSCLHRVVTNRATSRTSIAAFFSPSLIAKVGPAPSLIDAEHPAEYCDFIYADFLKDFYGSGGPNSRTILSHFENQKRSNTPKTKTGV